MTLADGDDDDVIIVENQHHLNSLWLYSFTVYAA